MLKDLYFSIVMPVYNVEAYIQDAVASVMAQTYNYFELILIDDCSTDRSPTLCDEIAANDLHIKVVHKPKNEGPSMARNIGIDIAIGNYIYFMDSDDTIDNTLFADVAESLHKNPTQVIMFGMTEEYFNEAGEMKEQFLVSYPEQLIDNQIRLRKEIIHIEYATLYGYACNKFYYLEYLKQSGARFQKMTLNEDIKFNVDYFMDVSSLKILGTAPYHYKKHNKSSLTARFVVDYFDLHTDRIQTIKNQYIYWGLYSQEVKRILGNIYCRYIYSALQRNCDKRSNMQHKDRKAWARRLFATDLFLDVIPAAHPDSRIVKVLVYFLKKKSLFWMLIISRTIFIIRTKLPMLFTKIKQKS